MATWDFPAATRAAQAYVAAHPRECLPSGLVAAIEPHVPSQGTLLDAAVQMAAACGAVRYADGVAYGFDGMAFECAMHAASALE